MNKIFVSLVLAASVIALSAVGIYFGIIPTGSGSSEVTRIKKAGVLIVGTDATYPPLESLTADGSIVGYDADVAKLIADKLGVKLELKNTSFDAIFDALQKGSIDLIVSSVSITPEREKAMRFSKPYFSSGQVIVAAKKTKDILTPIDLKGKRIGVQPDTTSKEQALLLTDSAKVVEYKDYDAAAVDLKAGKIQALIIDYPAGVDLTKRVSDLLVVGSPFTTESYGIAMRLSDVKLQEFVDQVLTDAKDIGELQQIQDRWFK